MKYYLDGKRVTLEELQTALDNLSFTEYGSAETIELDMIGPRHMDFITSSYNIYEWGYCNEK